MSACARSQCTLNSDCPAYSRCVSNLCVTQCMENRDCPASAPYCHINGLCVSSLPDAGLDASVDVRPIETSSGPDVPMSSDAVDLGTPRDVQPTPDVIDVPAEPVPVLRGYLDACASGADCTSGRCTTMAPQFCTRSCVTHSDCANGQLCIAGQCELDDTGVTGCNPSTAAPCRDLCYGTTTFAHCTHRCTSPSDCPSGHACTNVGGGTFVCALIEKGCTAADQCPTSTGFCAAGGLGCTATCATAADCPLRIPGLAAYTCAPVGGSMVCVPPADVLGSDSLGATCDPLATTTCRSGACDGVLTPPTCNQRCTPRGGCGPGYGCFPRSDPGLGWILVCTPAGRGWLGDACARARDCLTGLCSTGNYCTRMCNDGFCPTGMFCMNTGVSTADGTVIQLCSR